MGGGDGFLYVGNRSQNLFRTREFLRGLIRAWVAATILLIHFLRSSMAFASTSTLSWETHFQIISFWCWSITRTFRMVCSSEVRSAASRIITKHSLTKNYRVDGIYLGEFTSRFRELAGLRGNWCNGSELTSVTTTSSEVRMFQASWWNRLVDSKKICLIQRPQSQTDFANRSA